MSECIFYILTTNVFCPKSERIFRDGAKNDLFSVCLKIFNFEVEKHQRGACEKIANSVIHMWNIKYLLVKRFTYEYEA